MASSKLKDLEKRIATIEARMGAKWVSAIQADPENPDCFIFARSGKEPETLHIDEVRARTKGFNVIWAVYTDDPDDE